MFCLRCNRKAFRDGEKNERSHEYDCSLRNVVGFCTAENWFMAGQSTSTHQGDGRQSDWSYTLVSLTRYMSSQPSSSINSSLFNLLAALALHLSSVSLGRQQRLLGHATRMSDNRIPRHVERFHRGPRRPRQTRRNTVTNDLRESRNSAGKIYRQQQRRTAMESACGPVQHEAGWIKVKLLRRQRRLQP